MLDLTQYSGSINDYTTKAWELASEFQHEYIDLEHLYIAIIVTDSNASQYCKDLNKEDLKVWLQKAFPQTSSNPEGNSLPLTVRAEHAINHAFAIADSCDDTPYSAVHLLLAMLCVESEITEAFHRAGIFYEDVARSHFGKDVQKTRPVIKPARTRGYSTFEKIFRLKFKKQRDVVNLYYAGFNFYQYDKLNDCLWQCEIGLSIDPNSEHLRHLQVLALMKKRNFQEALPLALAFHKDFPETPGFGIAVAFLYDELGMSEEANALLDQLLMQSPTDHILHNNKGFALARTGRHEEAIPFYETAITLKPDFAYSWDNMGFSLHRLGQTEKGMELINKALELDKGNSFAYKYKGIIYMEQNNKEEAINNFQIALKYGYTFKYGNEVNELLAKLS